MKKITAALLIAVIAANTTCPVIAASLLTNSSDFSKAATYGMSFATNTMEKKNGKEAAEKLLYMDVMWDVMGKGEEFLLNGDPDAFPKFKDDVLKVKLVLDKVAEISASLGSGNYDDAAIASVDTMVGLVNHPVVNMLWESIKLAYESHKLVKSTKAALDIETLYGVVNQDRRLVGVQTGDAPALIPTTPDTVTYFYNKYLITDESTRALVKAYVKNKMGEEFPELSTSAWLYAKVTFTSDEAIKEHELRELQDFENKSRSWILALITDLNKQVTKQWAETRAFQERQKFMAFYEKFGKAYSNLGEAMEYFANINRLKKEKAKFPVYYEELNAKAQKAMTKYNGLKLVQLGEKNALRKELFDIASKCNTLAAQSIMIDEFSLKDQFEKLQIECLQFIKKIDNELITQEAAIVAEVKKPTTQVLVWGTDMYDVPPGNIKVENLLMSLFSNLIPAYKAELEGAYPDSIKDEAISMLSEGKLEEADLAVKTWEYEAQEAFKQANMAADKEWKTALKQVETLKNDAELAKLGDVNYIWKNRVRSKVEQSLGTVQSVYSIKYNDELNTTNALVSMFDKQKKEIYQKVQENLKLLSQMKSGALAANIDNTYFYDYLKENRYVSIGKISCPDVHLGTIGMYIYSRAYQISGVMTKLEGYIEAVSSSEGNLSKIDDIKTRWSTFPKLEDETVNIYNQLAAGKGGSADKRPIAVINGKTIRSVYNNPGWKPISYTADIQEIDNLVRKLNSSAERSKIKQFITQATTDIDNRQKDFEYLEEMIKQWNAWYQKQQREENLIMDSYRGRYVFGYRKDPDTGYAISNEPYPHFLTMQDFLADSKFSGAKADLQGLKVYRFINNSMPDAAQYLDKMFKGGEYVFAKEDNFLIGRMPVWKSDIEKAEKLISVLKANDPALTEKLKEIAKFLPLTLTFPEDKKTTKYEKILGVLNNKLYTMAYTGFPLGKKYVELREKLNTIRVSRSNIMERESYEAIAKADAMNRLAQYKQEYNKIKSDLVRLEKEIEIHDLHQNYWDLRTKYENDKLAQDSSFTNMLITLDNEFSAKNKSKQESEQVELEKVKEFYNSFKQAYESQNDSLVMSKISNDWECAEGTTTSDLENNFRNMFSVFNSINYNISNMNITKNTDGSYRASYDVEIVGQIYDSGITHKEKSSVYEIVKLEGKSFKISKTLNGRFWYVE